jgi:hypothetical protein
MSIILSHEVRTSAVGSSLQDVVGSAYIASLAALSR